MSQWDREKGGLWSITPPPTPHRVEVTFPQLGCLIWLGLLVAVVWAVFFR